MSFADSVIVHAPSFYESEDYSEYKNRSARRANPHQAMSEYTAVSHGVTKIEDALTCKSSHGNDPVIGWKALGLKNPKKITK